MGIGQNITNGESHYYLSDQINSARMVLGNWPLSESTYTPFGQEINPMLSGYNNNYKYTGMEQDAETDLGHTQYRQFTPVEGRWMSPDPYNGSYDLTNPQSFNRYGYVLNSPLSYFDPIGLYPNENGSDCTGSDTVYVTSDGAYDSGLTLNNCDNAPPVPPMIVAPDPSDFGPGFGPGPAGGWGGSAGSGTTASQNNNNTQQQQDCLNQYNNSAGGKAVQFLSLYNLATNLGSLETWAEWTLLPAVKAGAIAAVNSVSSSIGGTEIWSITSGASAPAAAVSAPVASAISTAEPVAAVAVPVAIGAATVVDVQVHAACAGITPQVELAPTVF